MKLVMIVIVAGAFWLSASTADAETAKSTSKSKPSKPAVSKSVTPPSETQKPEAPKSQMTFDTKPGPAYQTVGGMLSRIEGNIYVVEDYGGNEMRLYVGKETKKLRGEKKPGDSIRAEVTKGWYANSIQ